MRIVMISALLLMGIWTQAQSNGGELSGRTKTGGRLPVGVDSLAPLLGELMVSDSSLKVKIDIINRQGIRLRSVDSTYLANISSSTYQWNTTGTSRNGAYIFGMAETTPYTRTDGRMSPMSFDLRGNLRVINSGAGQVSVTSPSRSAEVGNYVSASIDTFGNTRVYDSIGIYYLNDIASTNAILADNSYLYDASNNNYLDHISDTTRLNYSKLVNIESNTNYLANNAQLPLIRDTIGKIYSRIPSGLTVNSNRLAIYSPDSIRVFATNGFGGSSSGGTSLDAVDSTNLALAGKARAIFDSTWTVTAMDTVGLAAKANSATVGWQTDTIGIRQWKATDLKLGVKISFANTAPANDKACYIYACPWWFDGTNWYASSGGTTTLPSGANSSYTIASPNDLVLLGVLSYTTQNQVCQRQFMLSSIFPTMPDAISFIIVNYTGAAVHTSGNLLYYSLVNKTQR